MYGEITNHPKYGFQFNVKESERIKPDDKDGIVEFLSSDLFPIGETTASKIVKEFGENTLDIILNDKDSLEKIPRLPKARIDKIHKVLVDYQYSSKIVIDLTSMGFSNKNAW